ncbi:MAG TPA: hypothetical protein VNZ86_08120, partial [Bacteroidia bacterium]|nr:hypothetical protein [Bacteroidia bacterium]
GPTGPVGLTGATGATGAAGSANAWGLTGTSGTNPAINFLGTTDTASLSIRTNKTEQIRINSTGNVFLDHYAGSGNGMLMVDNTGLMSRLNWSGNAGDVLAGNGTFTSLSTQTGWTLLPSTIKYPTGLSGSGMTYLIANPSSYVGIGTNSPTQALTVSGNVLADSILANLSLIVGGGLSFQGFVPPNTRLYNSPGRNAISSLTDLWINSQSAPISGVISSKMSATLPGINTILNANTSGNVGIGTTTPGYKLDVNGRTHVTGNVILDSNLTVNGTFSSSQPITFGNDITVSGNITAGKKVTSSTITVVQPSTTDSTAIKSSVVWLGGIPSQPAHYGPHPFWFGNMTTFTNLYLNSSPTLLYNTILNSGNAGNVGIGTNSPGFKLDVKGMTRISGMTMIDGSLRT